MAARTRLGFDAFGVGRITDQDGRVIGAGEPGDARAYRSFKRQR
jgi:hypothetical protein